MNPKSCTWLVLLALVAACSGMGGAPAGNADSWQEQTAVAADPGQDAGQARDTLAHDTAKPAAPDARPDTAVVRLDTIPPAPGMAVPPIPDRVDLPPGCPPATPDIYGLGAKCSQGGGECAGSGDGRVELSCLCDAWDGVRALFGTPCFCLARVPTPADGVVNEFHCRQTLGITGATTAPYSLRSELGVARYACLPSVCKGTNLSR